MSTDTELTISRVRATVWAITYTVLIYDYLCTLDVEVAYVWTCPWSLGPTLFYLNRYLPFVDIFLALRPILSTTMPQKECLWLFPLEQWLITIGLMICEGIIILRTYAIWGCRRLVFWILALVSLIVVGALMSVTGVKTYKDYTRFNGILKYGPPVPPDNKCQISAGGEEEIGKISLLLFVFVIFAAEAVVIVLTIIRAKQHFTQTSQTWVRQLYKNGILYCACMLLLSSANSALAFFGAGTSQSVLFPLLRGMHSVFCNRVIFIILENRNPHAFHDEEDGPQQASAQHRRVMDIFTSIRSDTVDASTELTTSSLSWQIRAQREWIS